MPYIVLQHITKLATDGDCGTQINFLKILKIVNITVRHAFKIFCKKNFKSKKLSIKTNKL